MAVLALLQLALGVSGIRQSSPGYLAGDVGKQSESRGLLATGFGECHFERFHHCANNIICYNMHNVRFAN